MAKPVVLLLAGLALVSVPGCGRKGPLVLPPGRVPRPVSGLTASAAAGGVVLRWTNPVQEISGRPLGPLGAVEIWILDKGLPPGSGPLAGEAIERTGRLLRKIAGRELAGLAAGPGQGAGAMTFTCALPPSAPAPSKLAFAVRVRDRRGRASEFAGPVAVDIPGPRAGVDRAPAEGVS